ncbi:MAG: redox-regulated ATPase YchF [Candidatus Lloydbacteria bacterium RIFCSPHIGHO2_02_FULL_51_22]|uniref:Ribosome-binding ATPase YchF n=1 Tax=Candidatus Lloydbacteria bacterium RIFCSPHIGHO2_02_FULL_51_22 TaxID=1798663 RepID=A0A1G2DIH0_9BACT|nr:MAG: redox-regulated ATPase YchF [Candidatus Lloydbacteria bacterium RIFCSPHIGHO2_02_FULL_51_22]
MLQIGIVGLPNVGKSTLFNALTNRSVPAENYPFCTIDPSVGVVAVPDARIDALAKFSQSAKVVPAAVEFTDIAGLVKGAAEGEGLGNKFLSHIRETDAIAHVVRIFKDPNVIHVHNAVDPLHDVDVIHLELAIADMQVVTKRRTSLAKEIRSGDKGARLLDEALGKVEQVLQKGEAARTVVLSDEEKVVIRGLGLLTMKPILYVLNSTGADPKDIPADLAAFLEKSRLLGDPPERREKAPWVMIDATLEGEIARSSEGDRATLRADFGMKESGLDALIRTGYDALGLHTFFTTGEDETRGWTIKRGADAREAGAAIHTDFRDKFIRAEVVFWKDLLDAGSYPSAREKGLVRTEGKEYIVKDGDVIEFKI